MLELIDSPSIAVAEPARPGRNRGPIKARVLVTGGSGFLGQHLTGALIGRGYLVRILDPVAPAQLPAGAEYVQGSVLDREAVLGALEGIGCVYHLAARAHLWAVDRTDFDRLNRIGSEIVLAAARQKKVRRFLHCSTEVVLLPPKPCGHTVDETIALGVDDMAGPYSRSKYLAEKAAFAAAAGGQEVVIVNPTIPIGAGDRNFTPPTAMLAHYLSGSRFFLDCMLNVVDARDVAQGMILAAERGQPGERYILGGENVSLEDLLRMIERVSCRKTSRLRVPPLLALASGAACEWIANRVTGRRPIATTEGVRLALRSAPFDNRKAANAFGYAPRPIEEALTAATRWLMGDVQQASQSAGLAEASVRS
jgi:dihydroflavonol-4-reductase